MSQDDEERGTQAFLVYFFWLFPLWNSPTDYGNEAIWDTPLVGSAGSSAHHHCPETGCHETHGGEFSKI